MWNFPVVEEFLSFLNKLAEKPYWYYVTLQIECSSGHTLCWSAYLFVRFFARIKVHRRGVFLWFSQISDKIILIYPVNGQIIGYRMAILNWMTFSSLRTPRLGEFLRILMSFKWKKISSYISTWLLKVKKNLDNLKHNLWWQH